MRLQSGCIVKFRRRLVRRTSGRGRSDQSDREEWELPVHAGQQTEDSGVATGFGTCSGIRHREVPGSTAGIHSNGLAGDLRRCRRTVCTEDAPKASGFSRGLSVSVSVAKDGTRRRTKQPPLEGAATAAGKGVPALVVDVRRNAEFPRCGHASARNQPRRTSPIPQQ